MPNLCHLDIRKKGHQSCPAFDKRRGNNVKCYAPNVDLAYAKLWRSCDEISQSANKPKFSKQYKSHTNVRAIAMYSKRRRLHGLRQRYTMWTCGTPMTKLFATLAACQSKCWSFLDQSTTSSTSSHGSLCHKEAHPYRRNENRQWRLLGRMQRIPIKSTKRLWGVNIDEMEQLDRRSPPFMLSKRVNDLY